MHFNKSSIPGIIIFAVCLLFVSNVQAKCKLSSPVWESMEIHSIKLIRDNTEQIRIRSRIADDATKRAAGFQHICPEIIELSSILFVYENPTRSNYHMFNVYSDLDIGFFNQSKELIDVVHMMPQDRGNPDAEYYSANDEFQFALEVRSGFFEEHHLSPGNTYIQYP